MATWNAEIIQMIKVAADVVGERQDIYISIFARDGDINITVYPWKGEEADDEN